VRPAQAPGPQNQRTSRRAGCAPSWAASRRAAASTGSATRATPGMWRATISAWLAPMRPAPMVASRRVSEGRVRGGRAWRQRQSRCGSPDQLVRDT
jgi:hypothetical protein